MISPPEVDGIYLRFRYNPEKLPSTVLSTIFRLGPKYGTNATNGQKDRENPSKGKKRMLIDFSSPNIAKEFHAGHLRSTIIGQFLSNLYEAMGWEVVRFNYLGDWGRQYGLLAIAWERFGDEKEFQKNPIGHLYDIYVKINVVYAPEEEAYSSAKKRGDRDEQAKLDNQGLRAEAKGYFQRMEAGDEEVLGLWRRFRDLSIDRYKKTYARLNIHFDVYGGESQVKPASITKAEQLLQTNGVTEVNDGAVIIDFTKHGAKKLGTAILRLRNGTTSYLLRDIGSSIDRYEIWHPDESIYVVMAEQDHHLAQTFKATELLGGEYKTAASRARHVNFGKVQGMSTRKGTVKFLDDILEEVGTAMHEVMKKNADKYAQVEDPGHTSDILGISAVMVQDMSGKRINNYRFDIDRMTSFEGDTGPYLQYAHARLSSIARRTELTHDQLAAADFSRLTEPHAINLLRLMAQYPDICIHAFTTLEPTTVLTYLFKLTHQLSSSYDVLRVINPSEGPEVGTARAALYEGARQVLNNGMRLLGLTPVDKM